MILALPLLLIALTAGGRRSAADTIVIDDVTVLPMDGSGALPHRTVIIVGQRIVAIRTAGAARPRAGTIVDGRGKFLLPGLA
ncbi:MAG TPA: hypothetical protein VII52_14375, partial [Gemmatimonadaceae bacterium]